MRTSVGIPPTSDILDHIYNLPTEAEREAAMEKIRAIEREAMQSQKPQPGLRELMTYLESKSIPKAICTRNFETPVRHLLDMFLERQVFDPIVTRDFRPPKPDPAGILHIAKCWGRDDEGRSLIMVYNALPYPIIDCNRRSPSPIFSSHAILSVPFRFHLYKTDRSLYSSPLTAHLCGI